MQEHILGVKIELFGGYVIFISYLLRLCPEILFKSIIIEHILSWTRLRRKLNFLLNPDPNESVEQSWISLSGSAQVPGYYNDLNWIRIPNKFKSGIYYVSSNINTIIKITTYFFLNLLIRN